MDKMKRSLVLLLVLALLLTGCGSTGAVPAETAGAEETAAAAEPTVAETEATEEPTTVPTEPAPVYRNPLNGEVLEEPFTDRIFANTVSNLEGNLPHVGVHHADVIIETFANMNNVVRCLALFTDIDSVDAIGSTRSTRPMFNDIAQHYDLILTHAGGSSQALADAKHRGITHYNIDSWEVQSKGTSYRDEVYNRAYENTLFGIGAGIKAYAEAQGVPMTLERDYGLQFTEDGMPAGESADVISVMMTYKNAKKETVMTYDAGLGKYVWNQYGKVMQDQITGETEAFTNVIVMFADMTTNGIYHLADFDAGGTGYYANGGKLIPITWTCAGEKEPFRFQTEDGQELLLGVGNTYINICPADSPVAWEAAEAPVTTEETAAG